MSSRLTLTLPSALENKIVEVDLKRFSIGRTLENDLTIEDTSLSRRHALIDNFQGHFSLSDCGSSNGTFVNGRQVTGSTELSDWDVLKFGGIGDILVRIEEDSPVTDQEQTDHSSSTAFTPQTQMIHSQVRKATIANNDALFSKPVIAVAAVVVIVLVTGLVLLISHGSRSTGASTSVIKKKQQTSDNRADSAGTSNDPLSTPPIGENTGADSGPTNSDVESIELSTIEAHASKVLTAISRDTHPVLAEKPVAEINMQVQRYKNSPSLQEEMRAMQRALPQVAALAKTNGIKTPLAVYATLARIDKDGGRGDPAQVAAALCPALAKMRTL